MTVEIKEPTRDRVEAILEKYQRDHSWLVSILQDVQTEFNYLPEDALRAVSHSLEIPMTQVYSVATFFKAFSLEPRGKPLINVCVGTACQVRGAMRILEKIERDLKLEPGKTTEDMQFSLESVNCVGACALGPMVVVDDKYHGQMSTDKVNSLLKEYE